MSFFKLLDREKEEVVLLKDLIKELAIQESRPITEIAAILLREYEEDIPFNEPFYFYYHDIVKSFVKIDPCHSRKALCEVAYGADIDTVPFNVEVRSSSSEQKLYDICVKASEMAMFFLDVDVDIPNSLSHVKESALEKYNEKYKREEITHFESESTDIDSKVIAWGDFAGKDTALMLISGLSVALARTHNACKHRNGRPNKSAIAGVATKSILSMGYLGSIVTDRQLRDLISNALSKCDINT